MGIYNGYVGARACTNGPSTGARGLMSWFLAKYADDGGVNSGIYNCRSIRGGTTNSLHGEGRAADLGIRPYRAGYGTALADLLRLHSKELGIQCIIWNRKIWSGYYDNWRKYTGSNPHVDHLHVELSWKSANMSANDMVDLLEKVLGDKVDGEVPATPSKPEAPVKLWQNSKNSKKDNAAIARLLNSLGYDAGVPDGVNGPYLYRGVLAYQLGQVYFPGMKKDGDWGPMCQDHYDWTKKKLQPGCNKWKAGGRKKLVKDGDLSTITGKYVKAIQKSNPSIYAKSGGAVFDNIPGPIFCDAFGIQKHPSA